jgi:hypothetical protein
MPARRGEALAVGGTAHLSVQVNINAHPQLHKFTCTHVPESCT